MVVIWWWWRLSNDDANISDIDNDDDSKLGDAHTVDIDDEEMNKLVHVSYPLLWLTHAYKLDLWITIYVVVTMIMIMITTMNQMAMTFDTH